MLAQHSSLCPVCGVYIAKSRSHIAKLPRAIYVQPHLWEPRLRNGWYKGGGAVYDPDSDYSPREWVHERCYDAGYEIVMALPPRDAAGAAVSPAKPRRKVTPKNYNRLIVKCHEHLGTDDGSPCECDHCVAHRAANEERTPTHMTTIPIDAARDAFGITDEKLRLLEELREAEDAWEDARRRSEAALERRLDAILAASAGGLTQAQIARVLGISQPRVNKIINSVREAALATGQVVERDVLGAAEAECERLEREAAEIGAERDAVRAELRAALERIGLDSALADDDDALEAALSGLECEDAAGVS